MLGEIKKMKTYKRCGHRHRHSDRRSDRHSDRHRHTHTQKLGQYERALEAYSKSLDIKIQVLDQHHPSLADTKYNMGDYEKALFHFPDVARSHGNIGNVHRLGNLEKALFHLGKANEVFISVFGGEHPPSLADTKYNMALLHEKRGERHLAKQLYLECEAVYATVYGPDHSETIDAKQEASDCD